MHRMKKRLQWTGVTNALLGLFCGKLLPLSASQVCPIGYCNSNSDCIEETFCSLDHQRAALYSFGMRPSCVGVCKEVLKTTRLLDESSSSPSALPANDSSAPSSTPTKLRSEQPSQQVYSAVPSSTPTTDEKPTYFPTAATTLTPSRDTVLLSDESNAPVAPQEESSAPSGDALLCAIGSCTLTDECPGLKICRMSKAQIPCSGRCKCKRHRCNRDQDCKAHQVCKFITEDCAGKCRRKGGRRRRQQLQAAKQQFSSGKKSMSRSMGMMGMKGKRRPSVKTESQRPPPKKFMKKKRTKAMGTRHRGRGTRLTKEGKRGKRGKRRL